MQKIDAFIRATYKLEIDRQETLPAHTFSWAPFRNDRMTLTLYRHAGRAGRGWVADPVAAETRQR